jgi:GDP-L-fucose synthase
MNTPSQGNPTKLDLNSKIYVAGHTGLVGSAIVRELRRRGANRLILWTREGCDLTCEAEAKAMLEHERPDYVFIAAAEVGGIEANSKRPVDFLLNNLRIQNNVISHSFGIARKLLFLGSSCIYPKYAKQPMTEDALLSGPLEPTNQWYAVAKIAGIKLCQAYRISHGADFISCMPTNTYGPGDNYNPESAHVIAAMIRKFHIAKESCADAVTCWGNGTALREFLYVDDLAKACVFLMENYSGGEHVNIGSGEEASMEALASMVASAVGFTGRIEWDASRPEGPPRKVVDSTKINRMGWKATTLLRDGLRLAYNSFKAEQK